MTDIFVKMLNLSICASYLVVAVLLIRCLLRRMPKWICCLLWGVVALRLLLPVTWESKFSLIPSAEVIPKDFAASPAISSGIPAVNAAVNPVLTQRVVEKGFSLDALLQVVSVVWLVGVGALLLYFAVSSLLLRFRVRTSVKIQKDVRICDEISTPFVFGFLGPTIYLPSGLRAQEQEYILSHERVHIRRHDHWWKPLGYLLLTVYWFNPVMWVAYIMLCRDIESACDEKVVSVLDGAGKREYAQALLNCSSHRRMIMACPVAFGQQRTRDRVKAVLNYKKASFWLMVMSICLCMGAVVCFASEPAPCCHSFRAEITKAPTCTAQGIQTDICTQCGYRQHRPAAQLSHSYETYTVTRESTCTEPGACLWHCSGCEAVQPGSLECVAHTLGAPYGITEPNCTNTGEETATCSQCRGVFVTQILPVNDIHDWVETVQKAATCTAEGEGILTCSRCEATESCTYERLKHHYVREKIQEATCRQRETHRIYCTDCGEQRYELGSHGSHTWKKDDMGYKVCIHCGWRVKDSHTDPFDGVTGSSSTGPTFHVIQWDIRITP